MGVNVLHNKSIYECFKTSYLKVLQLQNILSAYDSQRLNLIHSVALLMKGKQNRPFLWSDQNVLQVSGPAKMSFCIH